MKNKLIAISFVTILIAMVINMIVLPVYAADYGITFTVNPATTTARLGETISVDIGVADIDQTTNGINAIEGKITYDEGLFESVNVISAGNNWGVAYNELDGDELKGKFVLSNMNGTKENQIVAKLVAKVKSNATVKTGSITLNDMFSSYGSTETEKTTKTITVNIGSSGTDEGEKENENVIDNTSGDKSADKSSGTTTPSSSKSSSSSSKSAAKVSTTSALPKAGISSWIAIFVVAAIIVAVIEFIKYKRLTK